MLVQALQPTVGDDLEAGRVEVGARVGRQGVVEDDDRRRVQGGEGVQRMQGGDVPHWERRRRSKDQRFLHKKGLRTSNGS